MKKSIILAVALLISVVSKGQMWFDIGAKYSIGATAPVNQNIMEGDGGNYQIFKGGKMSSFYGFKLGINFNTVHSITPEFNIVTLRPMYSSTLIDVPQFNIYQIPVLYRKNSDNGGYVEVGPQISIIRKVTSGEVDNTEFFNKNTFDLALGGGQYIGALGALGFNLGFRANIPLVDMVAETSTDRGYVVFKPSNVDGFEYKSYKNLYVGVSLEVNLNFGYLQNGPSCHPGTRFKLF